MNDHSAVSYAIPGFGGVGEATCLLAGFPVLRGFSFNLISAIPAVHPLYSVRLASGCRKLSRASLLLPITPVEECGVTVTSACDNFASAADDSGRPRRVLTAEDIFATAWAACQPEP